MLLSLNRYSRSIYDDFLFLWHLRRDWCDRFAPKCNSYFDCPSLFSRHLFMRHISASWNTSHHSPSSVFSCPVVDHNAIKYLLRMHIKRGWLSWRIYILWTEKRCLLRRSTTLFITDLLQKNHSKLIELRKLKWQMSLMNSIIISDVDRGFIYQFLTLLC